MKLLWLMFVLISGCATSGKLPNLTLLKAPDLPDIKVVTGLVALEVCGRPKAALIVFSDGTYRDVDTISDAEFLLIAPQLRSARLSVWRLEHPRMCGLTPL